MAIINETVTLVNENGNPMDWVTKQYDTSINATIEETIIVLNENGEEIIWLP